MTQDRTGSRHSFTDEFLNPKSMLTPGFAGAATMLITNAFTQHFDVSRGTCALVISFLFGMLVFSASTVGAKIHEKGVLYILNSLIIFSVSVGSNQVGIGVSANKASAFLIDTAVDEAIAQTEIRFEELGPQQSVGPQGSNLTLAHIVNATPEELTETLQELETQAYEILRKVTDQHDLSTPPDVADDQSEGVSTFMNAVERNIERIQAIRAEFASGTEPTGESLEGITGQLDLLRFSTYGIATDVATQEFFLQLTQDHPNAGELWATYEEKELPLEQRNPISEDQLGGGNNEKTKVREGLPQVKEVTGSTGKFFSPWF